MKTKYVVVVGVKSNNQYEPIIHGEYTGIRHIDKRAAEDEIKLAEKDENIIYATIKEY